MRGAPLSIAAAAWRVGAEAPRFVYAPPPDLAALRSALLAIAGDLDGLSAQPPVTADEAVAIARRVLGIALAAPADDH